jgi:hypothetical protein
MGTGDLSLARLAIEDAQIAKAMLRDDNPFALAQSVIAHLVAAGVCEDRSLGERKAFVEQATRDALALEPMRNLPVASMARLWYFRETIDDDAAMAESLNRVRGGIRMSPLDELILATELYQHGQFQPALEALDRIRARGGGDACYEVCRCYVLVQLPDGPARALKAYRGLAQSNMYGLYYATIPQLLGRRAEARAGYLAYREQGARLPTRPAWINRLVDYNLGLIQEDALLTAAGSSRQNQCEAYFFIGLARLADGDRDGAKEQFRRSVATHVFHFLDHVWSRAFLARIEQDPAWPRWIPLKPK